jgi:hypothetical protein
MSRLLGEKSMRILSIIAIALICAMGASAVEATGVIKMVSSLPRTGSANGQVNGIRMAIDEVGGNVAGFAIQYEDWDDASPEKGSWDPTIEAANADKAIKDADVMVYIGTYNSGAAKISMPKLNEAGLVMISPANSYTGLTRPGLGAANEPDVWFPPTTFKEKSALNGRKSWAPPKSTSCTIVNCMARVWPTCSRRTRKRSA